MPRKSTLLYVDESLARIINDIQRRFYMSNEPISKVEASWVLARLYMGFDMNEIVKSIEDNVNASPTRRRAKRKRAIAMI